ncbi:MAG: hypothetical protein ACI8X5_001630 [Planctomycetota bacterium]|jgi:hypothetical protein
MRYLLFFISVLASCSGTRNFVDPIVQIKTSGGVELGVTTDYGIVFLGRTAQTGEIEVTAWFGDGPSIEDSTIEPIENSILYTAETEIMLPAVPMLFVDPPPGSDVAVMGRNEDGSWLWISRLKSDPRVMGLMMELPPEMEGRDDQIGAGVFRYLGDDPDRLQLLGLVSGRLRLSTDEGIREYATIAGPDVLWKLVTLRRHYLRRRPMIYRDDVL